MSECGVGWWKTNLVISHEILNAQSWNTSHVQNTLIVAMQDSIFNIRCPMLFDTLWIDVLGMTLDVLGMTLDVLFTEHIDVEFSSLRHEHPTPENCSSKSFKTFFSEVMRLVYFYTQPFGCWYIFVFHFRRKLSGFLVEMNNEDRHADQFPGPNCLNEIRYSIVPNSRQKTVMKSQWKRISLECVRSHQTLPSIRSSFRTARIQQLRTSWLHDYCHAIYIDFITADCFLLPIFQINHIHTK